MVVVRLELHRFRLEILSGSAGEEVQEGILSLIYFPVFFFASLSVSTLSPTPPPPPPPRQIDLRLVFNLDQVVSVCKFMLCDYN
ncbi:hypothetical protein YC2023_099633 [Brassica napus]